MKFNNLLNGENCPIAKNIVKNSNGVVSSTTANKNASTKDHQETKDPIEQSMGAMGKWQIFVCAVVFLMKFPVAWHQMAIIFLAPPAEFTCKNETLTKCDPGCNEHEFDRSVFTETIITEWDLVCSRHQLANLSQLIFMLGILTGNMFFGTLADKYGRRLPMVWAVMIQLVSGVAASFATNFWLFVVFRFFLAAATGGTMVTSFVLIMEIIGVQWRELVSVLYQIPFNLGHFTLPIFGYLIRDWQNFQFALSIPSVILISYYWLVPESPRWLLTVGRVDESSEILEKAAKMNNLPHENIKPNLELIHSAKAGEPVNKGNLLDLFRTPNLRMKTIFMDFNWFVCGLAFFGLAQYIGQLGGNIFANVAVSAALELPGTILSIYLMKKIGRRRTLISSNILTGVAMLVIAVVPSDPWINVTLASIGIIGMSISFPTVYLYAGELFPTVVRNVGIGVASTLARIGSMIAPFVAGLAVTAPWLPPVIFGVIPIIGSVLVVFLPETKGQALPETIEDGENFGKKNTESA